MTQSPRALGVPQEPVDGRGDAGVGKLREGGGDGLRVPGAAKIGERDQEGSLRPGPAQDRLDAPFVHGAAGLGGYGFAEPKQVVLGRHAEAFDGEAGVSYHEVGEKRGGGKDAAEQRRDCIAVLRKLQQPGRSAVLAPEPVDGRRDPR